MKLVGIKSLLAWLALSLSCSLSSTELVQPLPLTAQTPALAAPGGGWFFKAEPGQLVLSSKVSTALAHINFPVLVSGVNYGWHYFSPATYNTQPELIAIATLSTTDNKTVFQNQYVYNIYNNNSIVNANVKIPEVSADKLDRFAISFDYQHPQAWPGAWGNYSPRIRNVWAELLYRPNTCAIDPLSNTSCVGYAQALLDQQCTQNPLFSAQCAGYAQAYQQQQCSLNPLFSPFCSGYQQALTAKNLNTACNTDPQSSPQCAGYTLKVEVVTIPTVPDPVRDTLPKLVDDVVVQGVLDNTTQAKQTLELQEPPKTREQAIKQATSSKKAEAGNEKQASTATAKSVVKPELQPAAIPQNNTTDFSSYTAANLNQYMQVQLPDATFYLSRQIYTTTTIQDNPRTLRQLSTRSQQLHRRLVDEQYEKSR